MRRLFATAPAAALLLAAACASGTGAPAASSSSPAVATAPSPAASAGAQALTQEACRALRAADVQTTLGVEVSQLPMTSPPPGGGPDGSLVSGCTYASTTATAAGASLYLFRDMPIDYFAAVPGVQRLPGVGDAAFVQGTMLIGRKGHVTFQLTVVSGGDQAAVARQLGTLGRDVAARL